jgi:hypothetical protein
MLLAALAQVNTVLTDLLPDDEQTAKSESKQEPLAVAAAPVAKSEDSHDMDMDRGTAVSRDDLSTLRQKVVKPAPAVGKAPSSRPVSPPQKVEKRKSKKKSSGKKGDAFASLFGNLN